MTVAPGQIARIGRRPYERIATDRQESDSATVGTTETTVQSVTASLTSGRTYRVRWVGSVNTDTANVQYVAALRENNASGTTRDSHRRRIEVASSATGWADHLQSYYTATATGSKVFVVTLDRVSGSGLVWRDASDQRPNLFYVDYISG